MTAQDTQTSTAAGGVGRMRLAPQAGEVIDRSRVLRFTFNGGEHRAHAGDSIVSALAAAGERVFSRSFKYHRPRGLLTASFHDPGCMVQVGEEPNVRGAHRQVSDGMVVSSQNTWPSLGFDVKGVNRFAGRFLSAGFYYKTFMKPQALWPTYEKVLQRFVHAGRVFPDTPTGYFDKRYAHPDVLIAGGGPAGMAAALSAARAGAQVMLVEEEHHLGGHARYADPDAAAELVAQVAATEGIEVLTNAAVLGRYDDNWVAVVQRDLPGVHERLVKARAKTLVAAGGLIERPYVFDGNDTPGVMLSTAVRRLVNLWAVKPGERAVVLSANPEGDAAAADLRRAGVDVARVVDARAGEAIRRVRGGKQVKSVQLADGTSIDADLLVTATGWTAPTGLLNMAGDRPVYSPSAARFLPGRTSGDGGNGEGGVFVVGGLAGDGSLEQLCEHATAVGVQAALAAAARQATLQASVPTRDTDSPAPPAPTVDQAPVPDLGVAPHPELFRASTHGMVDLSEDVSSKDLVMAVREGYDSAELAKRYTTATMGPAQGKLETINAIAVIAEATGRSIAETGTTTWRPMHVPVTLGALAGRIFEPVRHSPLQPWHETNGAHPMVAGQWVRPEHYGDPDAEVRAVRAGVGIIDVTPIGKLDLHGPDVPKLLNLLYVNKWSKLGIGRVRYGAMCAEDGVVFDDGVTGRLGEEHYLMSTTSSGAAAVWEWVENWLQTEHPDWAVHVTPVTTAYASINVAGPHARQLVGRLTDGVDLSEDEFAYMRVRTGRIAGVDDCVLWRIGFTGELSYELHVPASYGLHVWQALLEHGHDLGVRPFGMEAQRILRLEKGHLIVGQDTDGLTKAYSAGLDWAVKLDKTDFAGRPELEWQHQNEYEHGTGARLVGVQPLDPQVVPAEASQILHDDHTIAGRITSSRHSPTLDRAICLAQLDAALAAPGTQVTIRLPSGEHTHARVSEHLAHVDPDGTRQRIDDHQPDPRPHAAPVARSPISPGQQAATIADWAVTTRRSTSPLTLTDQTWTAKLAIRAAHDGPVAAALGVTHGRTTRDGDDNLVIGSGPGEWLVLGDPGTQHKLLTTIRTLVDGTGEFATVTDLTHGRALIRVAGPHSPDLLSKVCGIDLSDPITPDGAALRTSVAKLATDLVRLDRDGQPAYLLHCERSSGQYLFDAILDAGAEYDVDIDGCSNTPTP